MVLLLILISVSFLTIVYYLGYFTLAIHLGVCNNHYFLGFGQRLFDFKIKGVLFTVGIFIPIFGLARIYRILITQNSIPYTCDVTTGGIQIMKPLLLHASSKATSQKHRRVIHLEFNAVALPNGLEWAERREV